jgi:hypothetical protein
MVKGEMGCTTAEACGGALSGAAGRVFFGFEVPASPNTDVNIRKSNAAEENTL